MSVIVFALKVLGVVVLGWLELRVHIAAIRYWVLEIDQSSGKCGKCREPATHLFGKGVLRVPLCQKHTREECGTEDMYEFSVRTGHLTVIEKPGERIEAAKKAGAA